MDFQEWYTSEWVTHREESGGIKARLTLLIAAVGGIFVATVALTVTVITVLGGAI